MESGPEKRRKHEQQGEGERQQAEPDKMGGCSKVVLGGFLGFLTLGILAAGAVMAWIGVVTIPAAAGWSGTPGTLTVRACSLEASRQGPVKVCQGRFVSDDGRVVDPAAPGGHAPGQVVRLRRVRADSYTAIGAMSVAEAVALTLMGVAILYTALVALLHWLSGKRRRPAARPQALAVVRLGSPGGRPAGDGRHPPGHLSGSRTRTIDPRAVEQP